MPDDDDKIIPIGKYKGQRVEVLQSDPSYADWLTAQAWFRERYAGLFQIIVNNFREPAETPEHNRLQARFLDPAFCQALVRLVRPADLAPQEVSTQFELDGWDVVITGARVIVAIEIKPALSDDFPAVLRQIRARIEGRRRSVFPSDTILVIDRFDAEGATLDQVRQMFGFPIVTIAEIEAIAL